MDSTETVGNQTMRIRVNDVDIEVADEPGQRLLSLIRDNLRLTGAKRGCEVGICGACTVMLDGRLTSSCITLAAHADGRSLTTIEGLTDDLAQRLRAAFIEEGGFQCGFCSSGQLVTAYFLISGADGALPEEELIEAMSGNLCRCTGYHGILRAIRQVAAHRTA